MRRLPIHFPAAPPASFVIRLLPRSSRCLTHPDLSAPIALPLLHAPPPAAGAALAHGRRLPAQRPRATRGPRPPPPAPSRRLRLAPPHTGASPAGPIPHLPLSRRVSPSLAPLYCPMAIALAGRRIYAGLLLPPSPLFESCLTAAPQLAAPVHRRRAAAVAPAALTRRPDSRRHRWRARRSPVLHHASCAHGLRLDGRSPPVLPPPPASVFIQELPRPARVPLPLPATTGAVASASCHRQAWLQPRAAGLGSGHREAW